MNNKKSDIVSSLSEFVRDKIGLHFEPKNYHELEYKMLQVSKSMGFKVLADFYTYLQEEKDQDKVTDILASSLVVGETYFCRDRELFKSLEESVLPALIDLKSSGNKTLRIWSAAAATGEEAYSVAMLLDRLIPDLKSWNISICATDINHEFLARARNAEYTDWSFRSAPGWMKEGYIIRAGRNSYKLNDRIRKMVKFSYLNLIQDVFPSVSTNTNAMDLILCRNVFIYFREDDVLRVSEKLYNCLSNTGYLVTTPIESFQYLSKKFKIQAIGNYVFYRKELKKSLKPSSYLSQVHDPVLLNEKVPAAGRLKSPGRSGSKKTVSLISEKSKLHALYEAGNYPEAEQILDSMSSNGMDIDSILLLARIKANLGKLDEAKAVCEKAITLNRLNEEVYYLYAMVFLELNDYLKAYEFLIRAIYIDPDFIMANFALGQVASFLDKESASQKYYANTLKLLEKMEADQIVRESDGITALRLRLMINEINFSNKSSMKKAI